MNENYLRTLNRRTKMTRTNFGSFFKKCGIQKLKITQILLSVCDMMEHYENLLRPNRIIYRCALSNNSDIANIGVNLKIF